MINLAETLTFEEGVQGNYSIRINWKPSECCNLPVKVYTETSRIQLPGIYFSVKKVGGIEKTFSDVNDPALIAETDTDIEIIIRYDKSLTGWLKTTKVPFNVVLEPTCANPKKEEIKGNIEWLIAYKCGLKISKFIEGSNATNPKGEVEASVFGGKAPYLFQLEYNSGTNSNNWVSAPVIPQTLLDNKIPIKFSNLDAGYYRIKITDADGFEPINSCIIQLLDTPSLIFNINSPFKFNNCNTSGKYNITYSGANDGDIHFNLLSNSKPLNIIWTGPYDEEPNISLLPTDIDKEFTPSLLKNYIDESKVGLGYGVGDLKMVKEGWYRITVIDKYNNIGVQTIHLTSPKKTKVSIDEENTLSPCIPGGKTGKITLKIEGTGNGTTNGMYNITWTKNLKNTNLINTSVLELNGKWATIKCESLLNLGEENILPIPTTTYDEYTDTTILTYDNVGAGNYEVVVKDCMGDIIGPVNVQLTEPKELKANIKKIIPACNCNPGEGGLEINLIEGRLPFKIILESRSNGTIEQLLDESFISELPYVASFNNLISDFWNIKIIENSGTYIAENCKQNLDLGEILIKKPRTYEFKLNEEEIKNPSCVGSNNGTISIIQANDCLPLHPDLELKSKPKIEWFINCNPNLNSCTSVKTTKELVDDTGRLISYLGNLPADAATYFYKISVISPDASCSNYEFVDSINDALEEPNSIDIILTGSNLALEGEGYINSLISNGSSPYTYIWKGPNGYTNTIDNINNLNPGTYSLTIIDANGCQNKADFIIETPKMTGQLLIN